MVYPIVIYILLIIFSIVLYKRYQLSIVVVILIAFLVRIITAILFSDVVGTDIRPLLKIGQYITEHKDVYPVFYFPFIIYLVAFADSISSIIQPLVLLRILYILCDIGITYMVFRISGNLVDSLLYAINPVSIIIFVIHAQFDSIPLVLFLLSLYSMQKSNILRTGVLLAIAIFVKQWPLLVLIPFFKRIRRLSFYFILISIPLLSVFVYSVHSGISVIHILKIIESYRGVFGVWGIGNIIQLFSPELGEFWIRLARRIFFLVFILFSLFYRSSNILDEIITIFLFIFTTTVTFGAQWLSWIVPLVIMRKPKGWIVFLYLTTIFLAVTFAQDIYPLSMDSYPWIQIVEISGFSVWTSILIMLLYRLRIFR